MGKTYRRERTINKVRKSRAVERIQNEENRILSRDELLEFIDCCNKAKSERAAERRAEKYIDVDTI